MIRSFGIGPDTAAYHLGIVAEGVEGPGRWTGRGAGELGLAGTVGRDQLAAVLDGVHPGTGAALHVRPVRVRGVELTFQVPKSVSVLWAVAGRDVAAQVDAGREAALGEAVAYLEEEALVVAATRERTGMVAAAFSHRTSRAGDPHLHAHLVVANLARTGTGRWMAVDRLALDRHLYTAGHLFEAHLRHELTERLGVRFGPVRAGVAQLEGMPQEVCRRFSRRRSQVESVMRAHGGTSAESARLAAVIDRPVRHPGLAPELLEREWEQRAAGAGFGRDAARRLLGQATPAAAERSPAAAAERRPVDPASLGLADRSTFSRREVVEAVCAARPAGIPGHLARAAAGEVVTGPGVVRVAGRPPLRRRDVVRTKGRVVVVRTDQERWTTREELVRRRRAAELAGEAHGRSRTGLGADAAAVVGQGGLRGPEAALAAGLLGSADGVQLLAAPLGPERERVLAACRRVWSDRGVRVMGSAADLAGAARLQGATGIDSAPLGEVTGRLAPLAVPVVTPTVLVVTDADQLGAPELVDLLETARRTEIGLILVGDPGRVPEVDRSGGWAAVAGATGCLVLGRPDREHDRARMEQPGERDPPLTPGGRHRAAGVSVPGPGEAVFRVGDRLSLASSPEALRDRLVQDWREAWNLGGRAVMVAPGRPDVADLNRRARRLLEREGVLAGPEAAVGGLAVRAGDHVVVASLDQRARRDGWRLGQAWRVGAVGPTGDGPGEVPTEGPGRLTLSGADGSVRSVPGAGVGMRWGYAATPYQAGRSGAAQWLVLGEPAALGPALPPAARFYVVAGIERGPSVLAGVARAEEARRRVEVLGHAAEVDPPAYLLSCLGPPPADVDGRRTWRSAAGAVEAYRASWGVADPDRALGPEVGPGAPALRRAERQEAARRVQAVGPALGRARDPSREVGRDRTG